MTNQRFADLVGCNFTTASRLRNGRRLPSHNMYHRICKAFKLDEAQRVRFSDAIAKGPESSGKWITRNLF